MTNVILDQLDQMLGGTLAPEVRSTGLRLRERLTQPVRVIVTGRAESGKSCVCRLLQSCAGTAELGFTEELIADRPPGLATQATGWADRADVVLWCTQDFDAADRSIWNRVPDRLKDHSFLLVTKADLLAAQGKLQSTLASLRDVADAFHSILPLATLQAIAAQDRGGEVERAAFRASGGAAVEAALLRDTQAGRLSDLDSARLFLSRYGARPTARLPKSVQAPQAGLREQVHTYLESSWPALLPVRDLDPDAQAAAILDHCCMTVVGLADLVARPADPDQAAFREDIMSAADTIELLRAEGEARAATDALGLLLQIRREVADEGFH